MSKFEGKAFDVHLTESVGKEIWYRGNIAGHKVWIYSDYVIEKSKVNKIGKLLQKDAKEVTFNGDRLFFISERPSSEEEVIGYIHEKDLTYFTHTSVDKKTKTFYIKGEGPVYNRAWGGKKI